MVQVTSQGVHVAQLTLDAINTALAADNCGQFRQNLKFLLPKMEDAYRGEEKPFRKHLGASMIGRDCSRQLQLGWHWTSKPEFPPRVLRLFNRGHLEEARFLSMLMCLEGVKLWYETEDGGQFKWNFHNGHYGSALDGIATGIPDIPNGEACYTEFKTSAKKGFDETVRLGCRATHPEHYVQMQECMLAYNLQYSLYMMVNKDNDDLYAEVIYYDKDTALRYKQRARDIIFSTEPLTRISENPTFYKCKFCDVRNICHGSDIPEINCRTCCHWTAEEDGTESCARNNDELFRESVYVGCSEHVFNPNLLSKFEYNGGDATRGCVFLREHETTEIIAQGPNDLTSAQFKQKYGRQFKL